MKFIGFMFAIRHNPTDKWLPIAQKGKAVRGASFVDPVSLHDEENPLRLFRSRRSANCAIIAYCKGKYHTKRSRMTHWGSIDDEYDDSITIEPIAWRERKDFEVVQINLIESQT